MFHTILAIQIMKGLQLGVMNTIQKYLTYKQVLHIKDFEVKDSKKHSI